MANKLVSALEAGPNSDRLRPLLDQLPDDVGLAWRTFCDAQLQRINELNRVRSRVAGEADWVAGRRRPGCQVGPGEVAITAAKGWTECNKTPVRLRCPVRYQLSMVSAGVVLDSSPYCHFYRRKVTH